MSTTNSKKQYESKLPLKIQKILAKEMKVLLYGKIEKINVKFEFDKDIKVGYGLAHRGGSVEWDFEMPNHLLFLNNISFLSKIIEKKIKSKVNDFNIKIKNFKKEFKKICKQYNANENDEFDIIAFNNNLDIHLKKWMF